MNRVEKENVSVETGIIATYQRMPQKLERVFAEFIDNSTQSYKDHRDSLIKANKNDACKVSITWNDEEIVISDNCFGMNHDDFRRALRLNTPKEKYPEKSRSQYGMGLKIAAAYLGNWYSIDSTQLGSSERYYSVVDIEEWKKSNPTKIDNNISDVKENMHYTKIVIKKLIKQFTAAIDKDLRKKLGNIYKAELANGELELTINGRPITSKDPELRINQDTGNEYFHAFEEQFEFNEKNYSFSGWIGILATASTDDAGFTLSQYGRGIVLGYRPPEIFGKSNSFQYQRLVGEIQLDDDKWKISFNKDTFIWDDGLEKAFIECLKSNKEVSEIKNIAGELRRDSRPSITPGYLQKSQKKIEARFQGLRTVEKTQLTSIPNDAPVIAIPADEGEKENIVEIEWESIKYKFDIRVKMDDPASDWFSLQKKSENNEYYIIINGRFEYFIEYMTNESKELCVSFAISLALAQLSSVRLGLQLKDSKVFISQLNTIIKHIK